MAETENILLAGAVLVGALALRNRAASSSGEDQETMLRKDPAVQAIIDEEKKIFLSEIREQDATGILAAQREAENTARAAQRQAEQFERQRMILEGKLAQRQQTAFRSGQQSIRGTIRQIGTDLFNVR